MVPSPPVNPLQATTSFSTTSNATSLKPSSAATTNATIAKKSSSRSTKEDDSKSLVVSTRKFYDLLCESQDFSVNLNEASQKLDLPKRRLYDITNVLEGINLLKKTSKNVIEWSGEYKPNSNATPIVRLENDSSSNNNKFACCLNILKQEYEALEEQERQIVKDLQEYLLSQHAYVSYNDIKSCFGDQIVIAVKAPPGSSVYVFDQSEIRLKSELGPIEAYLCPSSPTSQAPNNNQANKSNSINETPMNNNTSNNNNSKTFISGGSSNPSTNSTSNNSHMTPSDHLNHPSTSLPLPSSYASISSDEGRGTDQQHDPTLSSVSFSEDDALNFSPFDTRPDYLFSLDYNCAASSVFLDENDGLYE